MLYCFNYPLDRLWLKSIEEKKNIVYEKIEFLQEIQKKCKRTNKDLKERTAYFVVIHEVKIEKIETFLKDIAAVTICYNQVMKNMFQFIFLC